MLRTRYSPAKGFYLARHDHDEESTTPPGGRTSGFGLFAWGDMPGVLDSADTPEAEPEPAPEPKNKKPPARSRKLTKHERKQQRRAGGRTTRSMARDSKATAAQLAALHKSIVAPYASDSDVVVRYRGLPVYVSDVANLLDDSWLNDSNILYVYELLEAVQLPRLAARAAHLAYAKPLHPCTVVLLPPLMVFLLMHSQASLLVGVVPALEKALFVFLPVNDNEDVGVAEGGSHWLLVVVCMAERRALVVDTQAGANARESADAVRAVERYLQSAGETVQFKVETMPCFQQENGSDCGILVCQLTAVMVERLLSVGEGERVDMRVGGVEVDANAGRLWIMEVVEWMGRQNASDLRRVEPEEPPAKPKGRRRARGSRI